MKAREIRLSEVKDSLELLKSLCLVHDSCTKCCLYDLQEEETACLLVKTESGSLAVIIDEAQRQMERMQQNENTVV